jgi:hypothetical protein
LFFALGSLVLGGVALLCDHDDRLYVGLGHTWTGADYLDVGRSLEPVFVLTGDLV